MKLFALLFLVISCHSFKESNDYSNKCSSVDELCNIDSSILLYCKQLYYSQDTTDVLMEINNQISSFSSKHLLAVLNILFSNDNIKFDDPLLSEENINGFWRPVLDEKNKSDLLETVLDELFHLNGYLLHENKKSIFQNQALPTLKKMEKLGYNITELNAKMSESITTVLKDVLPN